MPDAELNPQNIKEFVQTDIPTLPYYNASTIPRISTIRVAGLVTVVSLLTSADAVPSVA